MDQTFLFCVLVSRTFFPQVLDTSPRFPYRAESTSGVRKYVTNREWKQLTDGSNEIAVAVNGATGSSYAILEEESRA